MTEKVYDEYVELSQNTSNDVIGIIKVHNQIYNLALDTLIQQPDMTFHELKLCVRQFIVDLSKPLVDEFLNYVESVLFNEIHYLFTRFRRKKAVHRKNEDISYMTLRVSDFSPPVVHADIELMCKYFQDPIILDKKLPDIKSTGYYNLSFSPQTNRFKLAVFS